MQEGRKGGSAGKEKVSEGTVLLGSKELGMGLAGGRSVGEYGVLEQGLLKEGSAGGKGRVLDS